MFTLEVARVHVRDLHRAAERSRRRSDARRQSTDRRRLQRGRDAR